MLNQGSLIQYPARRPKRSTQRLLVQQHLRHQQQLEMIYNQDLLPWWFDHRVHLPWRRRSGVRRPAMTTEQYQMRNAHSHVYEVVEPNIRNVLPVVNPPRIVCLRRRSVHTLTRLGVAEHVTQPLFYLALEELKEQRLLHGQWDGIESTSQFMAEYMAKNMTLGLFNAGNRPRYGPSSFPDAYAEDPQ
ncbi:uncharacterized protein LOC128265613 [Drosophila gunungcola]|uniref:Uncharacterized protein n=1 Tax=Drosophila gunungcola TaxID=103775 RepID=A0A9P9YAK8_9MUSC|nr:uncharacterized protein LOC128265613 [Drosophila gunungcola]KAI8033406.1 hypothetical protein M5D96_013854 [Drosophila gunungcola]